MASAKSFYLQLYSEESLEQLQFKFARPSVYFRKLELEKFNKCQLIDVYLFIQELF